MITIKIESIKVGENKIVKEFNKLSDYVREIFPQLLIGAKRMGKEAVMIYHPCNYPTNYHIKVDRVLLSRCGGILGTSSLRHEDYDVESVSEKDILEAYQAVLSLLEYAAKEIPCSIKISIKSEEEECLN